MITSRSLATLVAACALVAGQGRVQALQPVNLRCEHRVNPLGVGDATPGLSWQLQSDGQGFAYRGERQTAYEILVESGVGAADLWDSGTVVSSETDIVYAGQPLTSGKHCFWQVRVSYAYGNVLSWGAPAQWASGVLAPTKRLAQ